MDANAVALAAIGLASTSVVAVIWAMKYFAQTVAKGLTEHTKAAYQQIEESRSAREASGEVLTFMKNLNGKLSKATIQTVKEQNVVHQTVMQSDEASK